MGLYSIERLDEFDDEREGIIRSREIPQGRFNFKRGKTCIPLIITGDQLEMQLGLARGCLIDVWVFNLGNHYPSAGESLSLVRRNKALVSVTLDTLELNDGDVILSIQKRNSRYNLEKHSQDPIKVV